MDRRKIIPIKANHKRRRKRARGYTRPLGTAVLVAALVIGVTLDLDELAPEFQALLNWPVPDEVARENNRLSGRVTHVRDGDTVEVAGVPVRLANLDCAERGTSAGERAAARMNQLANAGSFSCRLEGRMSYDREVGLCDLPDGRDVGEVLIAERQCGRWY